MEKIYITSRQEFIEWKRHYTTTDDKFHAISSGEDEPKSYPCILCEYEDYNHKWYDYDTYYDFVYLSDFITNYEN